MRKVHSLYIKKNYKKMKPISLTHWKAKNQNILSNGLFFWFELLTWKKRLLKVTGKESLLIGKNIT